MPKPTKSVTVSDVPLARFLLENRNNHRLAMFPEPSVILCFPSASDGLAYLLLMMNARDAKLWKVRAVADGDLASAQRIAVWLEESPLGYMIVALPPHAVRCEICDREHPYHFTDSEGTARVLCTQCLCKIWRGNDD